MTLTRQITRSLTFLTFLVSLLLLLSLPAFSAGNALSDAPLVSTNTVRYVPGEDTVVQGVSTAGTVRVESWARFDSSINQVVAVVQVGGILLGLFIIFSVISAGGKASSQLRENPPDSHLRKKQESKIATNMTRGVIVGMSVILLAVMLPGCVNWLVASFRDSAICG